MSDTMQTGADQPEPAAPAHTMRIEVRIEDGNANYQKSADGSAWTGQMATAALASIQVAFLEMAGDIGASLKIDPRQLVANAAELAAQTMAAREQKKPEIVIAPPGFNPGRLRLARPDDN